MKTELTSANDIIWELMHRKLKVNITEVDRAVKALDKARQSAEYSLDFEKNCEWVREKRPLF